MQLEAPSPNFTQHFLGLAKLYNLNLRRFDDTAWQRLYRGMLYLGSGPSEMLHTLRMYKYYHGESRLLFLERTVAAAAALREGLRRAESLGLYHALLIALLESQGQRVAFRLYPTPLAATCEFTRSALSSLRMGMDVWNTGWREVDDLLAGIRSTGKYPDPGSLWTPAADCLNRFGELGVFAQDIERTAVATLDPVAKITPPGLKTVLDQGVLPQGPPGSKSVGTDDEIAGLPAPLADVLNTFQSLRSLQEQFQNINLIGAETLLQALLHDWQQRQTPHQNPNFPPDPRDGFLHDNRVCIRGHWLELTDQLRRFLHLILFKRWTVERVMNDFGIIERTHLRKRLTDLNHRLEKELRKSGITVKISIDLHHDDVFLCQFGAATKV